MLIGGAEEAGNRMRAVRQLVQTLEHDLELRREASSMSLYVSIVLLSGLSILNSDNPPQRGEVLLLVAGTTVGLVVAHAFAAWVFTYVMREHIDRHASTHVLVGQLAGALGIGAVAMAAVVLAPTSVELEVARFTVAAVIAAQVYFGSRTANPRRTAALHAVVALVAGCAVAALKSILLH